MYSIKFLSCLTCILPEIIKICTKWLQITPLTLASNASTAASSPSDEGRRGLEASLHDADPARLDQLVYGITFFNFLLCLCLYKFKFFILICAQ